MGVDGFFATIRASAWLSSASAVSRSGDVNLSVASRLAVSFFVFCWVVIGGSPDTPHVTRIEPRLDPQHKQKLLAGAFAFRPMRSYI
jgi:hypothetical protein